MWHEPGCFFVHHALVHSWSNLVLWWHQPTSFRYVKWILLHNWNRYRRNHKEWTPHKRTGLSHWKNTCQKRNCANCISPVISCVIERIDVKGYFAHHSIFVHDWLRSESCGAGIFTQNISKPRRWSIGGRTCWCNCERAAKTDVGFKNQRKMFSNGKLYDKLCMINYLVGLYFWPGQD